MRIYTTTSPSNQEQLIGGNGLGFEVSWIKCNTAISSGIKWCGVAPPNRLNV
jgi:hypothetical protein